MVDRVEVRPGDCFIIPGGLSHAIGPGVFMVEVQEPTDLVCQPERYCGDQRLSDMDMWQGLDHDVALDMFHYYTYDSPDDVRRAFATVPRELSSGEGNSMTSVSA